MKVVNNFVSPIQTGSNNQKVNRILLLPKHILFDGKKYRISYLLKYDEVNRKTIKKEA
jgi:hypothetical protein